MIGVGSSLGAWLGAEAAGQLVGAFSLTPYQLQLLIAAILISCAVVTVVVNGLETKRATPERAAQAEAALTSTGTFELIFNNRYLTWIAALTVLLNVVNSTGEFLLGTVVAEQARAIAPSDLPA